MQLLHNVRVDLLGHHVMYLKRLWIETIIQIEEEDISRHWVASVARSYGTSTRTRLER